MRTQIAALVLAPSPSPSAPADYHPGATTNMAGLVILVMTALALIVAWKLGFFDDSEKGNWK